MIEHVQRVFQWQRDDTPAAKLDKLERTLRTYSLPLEEVVPLFAALLSVPLPEERYAAVRLTPQQQKQQTHDALVAWMLEEAERQPVLVVGRPALGRSVHPGVPRSAARPVAHVRHTEPPDVSSGICAALAEPVAYDAPDAQPPGASPGGSADYPPGGGKALPAEVVAYIVARTDGVPLFVEELTKMLLESDLLHQEAERYTLTGPLSAVAIPTTLQDSLMARLDRLPMIREVAQLGAVLGRSLPTRCCGPWPAWRTRCCRSGWRSWSTPSCSTSGASAARQIYL